MQSAVQPDKRGAKCAARGADFIQLPCPADLDRVGLVLRNARAHSALKLGVCKQCRPQLVSRGPGGDQDSCQNTLQQLAYPCTSHPVQTSSSRRTPQPCHMSLVEVCMEKMESNGMSQASCDTHDSYDCETDRFNDCSSCCRVGGKGHWALGRRLKRARGVPERDTFPSRTHCCLAHGKLE